MGLSTPAQTSFALALVLRRGNASQAARDVGFNESHGRRLVSQNATLRQLLEEIKEAPMKEVRGWREISETARGTIDEILNKKYNRVNDPVAAADLEGDHLKLRAAMYAVDRVEGKPTVKVEQTVDITANLTGDVYRLAVNIVLQTPEMTMQDALKWCEQHPEQVREWAKANPLPAQTSHVE